MCEYTHFGKHTFDWAQLCFGNCNVSHQHCTNDCGVKALLSSLFGLCKQADQLSFQTLYLGLTCESTAIQILIELLWEWALLWLGSGVTEVCLYKYINV